MPISLAHVQNTQICFMYKINYSWYLDLHIRWFIMCTQTTLAVPKVAWINLLPLTWVNAVGLVSITWVFAVLFCSLVPLSPSWLTFISLSLLLQSYWLHKQCLFRGHVLLLWRKTNLRTAELVTCFLGWSKMLIFAKAAVARSLSLRLGRSRRATKASWGSNLHKSLGGVFHVSICHFF